MEYHLDLKEKKLGRIASEIATILQGKKHASFDPAVAGKDKVFVKNYDQIVVTGNKAIQKIYYRHTGYVGHLKELTFEEAFRRNPKKVLRDAVSHMMPKNRLNKSRIKNLVFVNND